ncbi:unnamed protein product, partial [Strongylus vulgaris]
MSVSYSSVDSHALEQSLEFIKSVMSSGDGAICADGSPASYHRQPVVAVVGAAGSQVSVMVASMLQLFRVRELGWTYVHAIADTGSYGERGMDSFRAAATEMGICIDGDVHKISRRWTDKNYRDLLIRMHHTRKARGVVMFVDEDNLKRLLHTLDALITEGHKELHRHFWMNVATQISIDVVFPHHGFWANVYRSITEMYHLALLTYNEPPLIDANGDGIGRYDVFQLNDKGIYQKVGKWRSSEDSFEVRVEQVRRGFRLAPGESPLSVCSVDCPRGHYRCEMCPEGEVPDVETQSYCLPIPPVSMSWDTAWALIPAGFSLLGLSSTIFVVGVFLKFSDTPVIMASGRELCYCMISGISMCYLLTFFLVSQPSIPTCACTRVLMGLSMSAIYAAIITKTNRLARVFKPDSAQRPRYITPRAQVGICACIVSVQLFGSLVWLVVDPPGT